MGRGKEKNPRKLENDSVWKTSTPFLISFPFYTTSRRYISLDCLRTKSLLLTFQPVLHEYPKQKTQEEGIFSSLSITTFFYAIYAYKFDSVLKMRIKYVLSHMSTINLSSKIAFCGTKNSLSVGNIEKKSTASTFLTSLL